MHKATLILLIKANKQEGLHAETKFICRCAIYSAHASWVLLVLGKPSKRHYKLTSQFLTRLSEYVEDSGKLDGHDDVPEDI
ncbi:uncharacterized protein BJX67DRAFT_313761 [Aspergillus lucknowensis]|uniref:Uncharacterized protein n=1 Tax=Aspergillus lucknowensis TaxID=176173 RepID=A0ABR4L9L6_9EURO